MTAQQKSQDNKTRRTQSRTVWLTINEAGEAAGISRWTVRRRISDGTLPAYKVGRFIRIKEEDLDRIMHRIPAA